MKIYSKLKVDHVGQKPESLGIEFAGIHPAGSVAGIPVSVAGPNIGCRSEIDQYGSLNNFVKSTRIHGHSFTRVKRLTT